MLWSEHEPGRTRPTVDGSCGPAGGAPQEEGKEGLSLMPGDPFQPCAAHVFFRGAPRKQVHCPGLEARGSRAAGQGASRDWGTGAPAVQMALAKVQSRRAHACKASAVRLELQ